MLVANVLNSTDQGDGELNDLNFLEKKTVEVVFRIPHTKYNYNSYEGMGEIYMALKSGKKAS